MAAAGSGEPIALTTDGKSALGSWSPNGRQIAFARNGRPYIMNADGSDPEAVPIPPVPAGTIVTAYDWAHR